jgi:ribosome modulation factor
MRSKDESLQETGNDAADSIREMVAGVAHELIDQWHPGTRPIERDIVAVILAAAYIRGYANGIALATREIEPLKVPADDWLQ